MNRKCLKYSSGVKVYEDGWEIKITEKLNGYFLNLNNSKRTFIGFLGKSSFVLTKLC